MNRPRLYTIGNFTIDDLVFWPSGRTWMGQAGGNVVFSALGARIWIDDVGIVARVGRDYPEALLSAIEARGITLALHRVDAPTLHDWGLYEADGQRQFVNHLASGSNAIMTIEPGEIPGGCLAGLAYHLAPVPSAQQAALVGRLRRSGCLIALDLHESWISGNEDLIRTMLASVDFFLPSDLQATMLYGSRAPEQAAREFARLGPQVVVIKLGAEGSLVCEAGAGHVTHVPVYPATVADTTGAGDAYCGGFLAGYLITGNPLAAARYGTVSASYAVESVGALSIRQPAADEARARLEVVASRSG